MNRFQKAGLAILIATSMAFAQLWTAAAPHGQVQFPWVVECTSSPDFDESDEDSPCYKEMGGFWWGYLAGWEDTGEVGPWKCPGAPGQSAKGGQSSAVNKARVKINGEWENFVGVDSPTCLGPDITDKTNGLPLIGDALEVELTVGAGFILDPDYEPSLAGFGVSLVQYEATSTPRNVKDKEGFCLTYSSDHENTRVGNTGSQMVLTLGWNEGYKPSNLVKGFDAWYAIIPPSNGQKVTKDFKWTGDPQITGTDPEVVNEAGMFIQDNWTNWPVNKNTPPGAPFPIDDATQEMTSVKINFSGYEAKTVVFKLYEFGFAGQCTGNVNPPVPIVAGGVRTVNPVGFEMIGKTLSMNSSVGKPLAVQVINLQGAVVQTKTMSNGDKLSLQNLPTGIYLVRVPALGYTVKQAVK
jgi:hypothetical protein